MSKTWYPIISYELCITCGRLCPVQAIDYFGESSEARLACSCDG
ncbi:MAG: hypothetical protein PHX81_05710 [Eubacteriales bacterium]|jgi:formate hydrogenlyase subunit 6/NADH:ubiquinone oxidoreductase subunit I|nr:hypothetical protein [Eubacteriales bacterium]MDD4139696.1 hypothetical protein [Eubacteriales bacterium]